MPGKTKEELKEENALLMEQVALLSEQVALMQQVRDESQERAQHYLLVRSNISGFTTVVHPDVQHRGKLGDRVLSPFSEVLLPMSWKDSPNLDAMIRTGVATVREVDGPPDELLTMPSMPTESRVHDPIHRRMAFNVALNGTDADEGSVQSYDRPTHVLLMDDILDNTGEVDRDVMRNVVAPVLELALWLEENWRNRKWVTEVLKNRLSYIDQLRSYR